MTLPDRSVINVKFRFNPVPMFRVLAEANARLALLVVKDPKRRWRLQHRIDRIRKRRGA